MAGLNEAIALYVANLKAYKTLKEKEPVVQGFVTGTGVNVGGMEYSYDCIAPRRIVEGDLVYAAYTDSDGKMVILG